MHGRNMCTLCNVFMINKTAKEQSQTSFHGGVEHVLRLLGFRRTPCPFDSSLLSQVRVLLTFWLLAL